MNWKLIFKTSVIFGAALVIANCYEILYSIDHFYGAATTFDLILVWLMYAAAICIIPIYIFRKTEKHRIAQAILTLILSAGFSIIFTFPTVIIFDYAERCYRSF